MKAVVEHKKDGTNIVYNIGSDKVQLIGTGDTVAMAKEDFRNSRKEISQSYVNDGVGIPEELL